MDTLSFAVFCGNKLDDGIKLTSRCPVYIAHMFCFFLLVLDCVILGAVYHQPVHFVEVIIQEKKTYKMYVSKVR